MELYNIFSFNNQWNYRNVGFFVFLIGVPNLLGLINISTPFGKIHFFQLAIFLAAVIYGPVGGLMSGLFGSVFSAVMMHNPYIVGGNMILGFFVGVFVRIGIHTFLAVLLAFICQLPWLVITDYFLVGLSGRVILLLIVALFASNSIWALVAHYSQKPVESVLG